VLISTPLIYVLASHNIEPSIHYMCHIPIIQFSFIK